MLEVDEPNKTTGSVYDAEIMACVSADQCNFIKLNPLARVSYQP